MSTARRWREEEGIRKPRRLCGVSLSVNCWDWTKAITLPRSPGPWRRIPRQVLPES